MGPTNDPLNPDEETALLTKKKIAQPTPLPKLQIGILMFTQLAEPISAAVILPYLNQMVSEFPITGGDPAKTGYYVGLMVSLFFATEAFTVLYWSRLSDRIGRKPVLLMGLGGIAVSMVLLGLARSFWAVVFARCLCGALNGNTGVAKSAVGEMTDKTNVAQAFSLMPVVWATGFTIAPVMGGMLQHPFERFPRYFDHPFWKAYPYFLPPFVAAVFTIFTFVITLIFFKETVHDEPPHPAHTRTSTASTSTADTPASPLSPSIEILGNLTLQNVAAGSLLGAGFQQGEPALAPHARIPSSRDARPLSSLLSSPRVRLAVANYGMLSLLDIALNALLPVVLASAIRLGGLGRSPETIGALMGTFGLVNGIVQATVFTRVVRRVGLRTTFTAGICSYFGIWTCFFGANWIARKMGASVGGPLPAVVWAVFAAQNVLTMLMDMSFGTIFIYITSAAPDKRSLGATNGIAQQTASIVRAIGPALATSLFAFSVEHQLLGGYFVYLVLGLVTVGAVRVALMLPREAWEPEE